MLSLANRTAGKVLKAKWSDEILKTGKSTEIPQKTSTGPEPPISGSHICTDYGLTALEFPMITAI